MEKNHLGNAFLVITIVPLAQKIQSNARPVFLQIFLLIILAKKFVLSASGANFHPEFVKIAPKSALPAPIIISTVPLVKKCFFWTPIIVSPHALLVNGKINLITPVHYVRSLVLLVLKKEITV